MTFDLHRSAFVLHAGRYPVIRASTVPPTLVVIPTHLKEFDILDQTV